MEWHDHGIVVAARRHGESSSIVSILTENQGRHLGVLRTTRKTRALLQAGTEVTATWKARLPEHLGTWSLESTAITCATILNSPASLAALSAACAWTELILPEREQHVAIYKQLSSLLHSLAGPAWWPDYVRFELQLLQDLGFGLDLSYCAATGDTENLTYVSPRTGRAVSRESGRPYHDRLLTLPAFLTDEHQHPDAVSIKDGLRLTGYFMERWVLAQHNSKMPAARKRLCGYVPSVA